MFIQEVVEQSQAKLKEAQVTAVGTMADFEPAISQGKDAQVDLDTLFVPFHRLNRAAELGIRGIGLGLYISRCLVQAHGGEMWARSNPQEGSTFCFSLPIDRLG